MKKINTMRLALAILFCLLSIVAGIILDKVAGYSDAGLTMSISAAIVCIVVQILYNENI